MVVGVAALFIDYRLNIRGIRICEHSCQLIARSGKQWGKIGPRGHLPVHVPVNAEELKMAAAEPLCPIVAAVAEAPAQR